MLYIHNVEGQEITQLDLTSLGNRIKDFTLFNLPTKTIQKRIQNVEMRSVCEAMGSLISLITSTGTIAVLSVDAVAQGMSVEACTLTLDEIKLQPRLVSVAVVIGK